MKSKYSVIVFDLGNVLLPFDYKLIITRLESIEKGLGEKFVAFYRERYDVHRQFERGDLSEDAFVNIMLDVVQHKISGSQFCEIYSKIFSVNYQLAEVLPGLKENYKVVLMSNTNPIHENYGWKDYDFLKYFDKLILSHEVRAVKPEEAIYRAVEKFTGAPPEEHFYTDDIPDYIEGARRLGWDASQFVGNEALFREFQVRGIVYR